IYDMHIHVGAGPINQNYLLEQMEKSGVYGGGIISDYPVLKNGVYKGVPYKERMEKVVAWKKGYEGRLFSYLWVHPFEKNAEKIVKDAAESGIDAFKMICDTYSVYDKKSMKLLEAIEKTGKPVVFHSGILWSGTDTSIKNRPVNWESLLNLKGIKFSMGHCSWPWVDECIAVYGKFLNSYLTRKSSEMFFDITPGTPVIYREELLTKLFRVGYDVENNIMFGTDSITTDYNPEWVSGWIARDNAIYDEIGVTEEKKEKVYCDNFMRFIKGEDIAHILPQINKG
ncbi:MAG: amidohydrolase family protein, partial [Clostridia bacterium]|nr:amidohydrolase family protein [Clostridia bacterium]